LIQIRQCFLLPRIKKTFPVAKLQSGRPASLPSPSDLCSCVRRAGGSHTLVRPGMQFLPIDYGVHVNVACSQAAKTPASQSVSQQARLPAPRVPAHGLRPAASLR
jgi:hypothetical protein